jgi:hypothetical protein
MSDKIVLAQNEVALEYGLSVLKGIISAVPVVGGALNEILFAARSRLKQDRLNRFFQAVAEDVKALQEQTINRDFLASDEFSDLLEDICLRVAKAAAEEKRAYFRRVLVNAFQGKHDPDFAPMFMVILSDISEAEVTVLSAIQDYLPPGVRAAEGKDTDRIRAIDYTGRPWGLDGTVARQVVQSLISKGLLVDDSLGRLETVAFTCVARSDLGARFVGWLGGSDGAGHDS